MQFFLIIGGALICKLLKPRNHPSARLQQFVRLLRLAGAGVVTNVAVIE
jgi:hypothetical protein